MGENRIFTRIPVNFQQLLYVGLFSLFEDDRILKDSEKLQNM